MTSHAPSRVGRNVAAGTAAQCLSILVGLLTTPVFLHALGITRYGAFALIASLTTYFGILDFGIGGGLTRFMAFYHERGEGARLRRFATFGVLFYLGLAALLSPALVVFGPDIARFLGLPPEIQDQSRMLFGMLLALFIGWSLAGVMVARLAAGHRLDLSAYANICGSITFAVLGCTLVPAIGTISSILACMIGQLAVVMIFLAVANRRFHGAILASPFTIRWMEVRELFSFGLWAQAANLSSVINLEADKVIISRGIGVDQVTPYQVANRMALLSRALPIQLLLSLLPAVTAQISAGVGKDMIGILYERTARSLMVPTLVVVGFVAGASDALLRLWLGTHLPGAAALCVALVISYAVNNVTGAGTVILKAQGRPQLETFYGILSAVLNIGLTIVLIRPFGLNGVVVATIVGNVVGSTVFVWLFHRTTSLGWWTVMGHWLARLVLVTAIAGVLVHAGLRIAIRADAGRPALALALTVAGLLYLAAYYGGGQLLRIWTPDDQAMLRRVAGILPGKRLKVT